MFLEIYPDKQYFNKMVGIAKRNEHCEILCFTKKYEIVNSKYEEMIANNEEFPSNLHVIFSGWINLVMNNPYNFPEAHVRFRDGTTTASSDAKECIGNCTTCAITDSGCWEMKNGEQVVFDEH